MEYTKGEWKVAHEYNVAVGNRGVASCGGYTSNMSDADKITQENIANAHLISASPDMYEALKEILPENTGYMESMSWESYNKAIKQIRQALAKAEGK